MNHPTPDLAHHNVFTHETAFTGTTIITANIMT
jgi:hypothetical protein